MILSELLLCYNDQPAILTRISIQLVTANGHEIIKQMMTASYRFYIDDTLYHVAGGFTLLGSRKASLELTSCENGKYMVLSIGAVWIV